MSRFTPCRETTLQGSVRDCAGKCMNRGVRTNCPCQDLLEYGPNVLNDPGFEIYHSIPEDTNLPTPRPVGGYAQGPGAIAPNEKWVVVDASDPDFQGADGGSWHARADIGSGLGAKSTGHFYALEAWDCRWGLPYSARVEPGDLVTWSVRAKASQVFSGQPVARVYIGWRTIDNTSISFTAISETALTTSYATYSISAVAPANSYFCRTYYHPATLATSSQRIYFSADNCTLEVS